MKLLLLSFLLGVVFAVNAIPSKFFTDEEDTSNVFAGDEISSETFVNEKYSSKVDIVDDIPSEKVTANEIPIKVFADESIASNVLAGEIISNESFIDEAFPSKFDIVDNVPSETVAADEIPSEFNAEHELNDEEDPNVNPHYHITIGIPQAAAIKAAEEAMDFSGSRIVGGSATTIGRYPHFGGLLINLTNGRQSICGSSLISNTRLVTAAHCWRDGSSQGRSMVVVLASVTLFSGGRRITTSNISLHPSYNSATLRNDIAVIRIPRVAYTNNIRNIPLASGSTSFAGTSAMAVGFGRQRDSQTNFANQRLHHVRLSVITNAVCQRTFSGVVASNICTSGAGGRSICQGDSGGPLETVSTPRRLIGVSSFVHRNGCTRGFPAGYARVTSFRSWILRQ